MDLRNQWDSESRSKPHIGRDRGRWWVYGGLWVKTTDFTDACNFAFWRNGDRP